MDDKPDNKQTKQASEEAVEIMTGNPKGSPQVATKPAKPLPIDPDDLDGLVTEEDARDAIANQPTKD